MLAFEELQICKSQRQLEQLRLNSMKT